MSDTWVPADVKMEDYWADAIGGEYRPVKHGKHSSFHPKTVKAVLDSVRGTEVADVIVGLVFALTKSDDLRRWANDQLLEEMKRSAALEEENRRMREALEAFDKRLEQIGGCSDGYCLVTGKAKGMHTNGGCRCCTDKVTARQVMFAAQQFREAIRASLSPEAKE